MSDFVEVAQLDKIPPGSSSFVRVGDKSIALFLPERGLVCKTDKRRETKRQ